MFQMLGVFAEFERKRRTNPAFRISRRVRTCAVNWQVKGTHDEGYGSFWS